MNGQLHAPAAIPPGKSPLYKLDRWLDGPQSCNGRCEEEKNLICIEIQTPVIQRADRRYTDRAIPILSNIGEQYWNEDHRELWDEAELV
jgi:hypothetical protein